MRQCHLYAVVASVESLQSLETLEVRQRPQPVLLNVQFLQLVLTHK